MKSSKAILRLCLLAALPVVSSIAEAAPIVLTLEPSPASLSLNGTTDVAIQISGLTSNAAPSLAAFDLQFFFNPLVLSFVDATYGDPGLGDQLDLEGFGGFKSTSNGAGFVSLLELSFDGIDTLNTLQADAFTLATIRMQGIGLGSSALSLTISSLSDAIGNGLTADEVGTATVRVTGTQVVPEPGTWSMFGISATLLAAGSRLVRRKR